MFQCQLTGETVPPGIKPVKLVTKKRKVTYPARHDANRVATWLPEKADKIRSTTDPGGEGWEIAEELDVSPKAAHQWHKQQEAGEVEVQWLTPRAVVLTHNPFENLKPRGRGEGYNDRYHRS